MFPHRYFLSRFFLGRFFPPATSGEGEPAPELTVAFVRFTDDALRVSAPRSDALANAGLYDDRLES